MVLVVRQVSLHSRSSYGLLASVGIGFPNKPLETRFFGLWPTVKLYFAVAYGFCDRN
jgi:hypothetical protein